MPARRRRRVLQHLVAVGLAHLAGDEIENEFENADALKEIQELLKPLDRAALAELVMQQALWDERLFAELRLLSRAESKNNNKIK